MTSGMLLLLLLNAAVASGAAADVHADALFYHFIVRGHIQFTLRITGSCEYTPSIQSSGTMMLHGGTWHHNV